MVVVVHWAGVDDHLSEQNAHFFVTGQTVYRRCFQAVWQVRRPSQQVCGATNWLALAADG